MAAVIAALRFAWSPIGRVFATVAMVLAVIAAVFLRGRHAGMQSERARQQRRRIKAYQKRTKVDESVARRRPDARRDSLREWTRD